MLQRRREKRQIGRREKRECEESGDKREERGGLGARACAHTHPGVYDTKEGSGARHAAAALPSLLSPLLHHHLDLSIPPHPCLILVFVVMPFDLLAGPLVEYQAGVRTSKPKRVGHDTRHLPIMAFR